MARQRRVSIIDVATAAGTSKSTDSPALLDQPGVSAEVRRRVREAATELGYVKDFGATALRTDGFRTIGLYVRAIGTEFYGLLAAAISEEADAAGYSVASATSTGATNRSAGPIDYLRSLRSEAIIVASGRIDNERLDR
ncbi:LacI family DNA-binding transcriptional regulator [Candidatus Poriferisocius sp.]|uniref:LacI family DNA-binding transcriptional regulator n=1 Tax=Candidatus Poriferisocius sp. TaxID=3101276 RepID=UPI003B013771